jgi:hypothetical protein
MSVTATSKIVTSLDTASRAVTVQLANLDWVTTIEGINVSFHTKAHEVSGIGIQELRLMEGSCRVVPISFARYFYLII